MKGKTSLSFTSSFVCTWESYLMPFYFYFKKEIFLFAIFFSSFHSNKKRNNREACSRRSPRCPIFVFGAIIVLDLKRKKSFIHCLKSHQELLEGSQVILRVPMVYPWIANRSIIGQLLNINIQACLTSGLGIKLKELII